MLIKGGNRGNASGLAKHVKAEENETVRVVRTVGIASRDIDGALAEMDALGAGLRTSKTLYHASINPEIGKDREMTARDLDDAVNIYLKKMGLEPQPYILIEHEKFGEDGRLRRHWHVVSSVADLEHNRAIRTSHNFRKHEEASREIERHLGHEHVQGAHVDREGKPRPDRTPTHAEMQQAKRGGVSAQEAKALGAELWNAADSGKAIKAALESHGWQLARGDKPRADGGAYFMAIDPQCGTHELRRMVPVKAQELYARIADLDPATLPSVKQAKDMQRERHPRREMQPAANQNIREPMTLEAIERDPWKAVDLALPKDADRTMLAAVALCADKCAKTAFAYGRVAAVTEPERAEFLRDRHDSAAARRDEARRELAGLAPEQMAEVSPLLHPQLVQQRAEGWLQAERAEQILARDPMREARHITPEAIKENRWNVLHRDFANDASRALAEQVLNTARDLYHEALQYREESYTPEERQLWDHTAKLIENVPFGLAGERLTELDRQELKAAWRDTGRETTREAAVAADDIRSIEVAAARTTERVAPIFDRDAASRAADEKIIDAAIAGAQEGRQRPEPPPSRGQARAEAEQDAPAARSSYAPLQAEEPAPPAFAGAGSAKAEPALTGRAGDIRMAWSLSRSASELQEGLAAHGLSLAQASAEEARASERTAAFAKEVGNYARLVREGEIVAVDGSGHVYRLDERTTGQQRPEIEGQLAGLDRDALLNIADTKAALREAAQAEWVEQQRRHAEQIRLPNRIESRIAECADQARRDVTTGYRDDADKFVSRVDALADRFKPEDEQKIRTATVHGTEAFAARLDEAGLAIARVTEADIKGLAALRHDEDMARVAAETNNEAYKPHHFAADLVAGDIAAVTRDGDVYRINPDKLGDAKQYLVIDLPGVIETRAKFEIERETTSALWNEQRTNAAEARADFAAGRESQHQAAETARDARQFNQDIGEAVDTGFKASSKLSGGFAKVVETFLGGIFSFFGGGEPKLTPLQQELKARADEERAEARAGQTAHAERTEAQYWLVEEARRRAAEKEAGLSPESERRREDDRDRDRGYRRER